MNLKYDIDSAYENKSDILITSIDRMLSGYN